MPGYWQREQGGVLRDAIEGYLFQDRSLSEMHWQAIRAYLTQWLASPLWRGPQIDELRATIATVRDRRSFGVWLACADSVGIDPL